MIDCFPATEGITPVLGKIIPLMGLGLGSAGEAEVVQCPRGRVRKSYDGHSQGDAVNISTYLIFKRA